MNRIKTKRQKHVGLKSQKINVRNKNLQPRMDNEGLLATSCTQVTRQNNKYNIMCWTPLYLYTNTSKVCTFWDDQVQLNKRYMYIPNYSMHIRIELYS